MAHLRTIAATVVLAALLVPVGQQTACAQAQARPFAVEYYYKVKWGHFEEFLKLYKRFELLLEHLDVPVREEDPGRWEEGGP